MSTAKDNSLLVHRCRFIQTQPSAINCLALNETETLLAIGRDNHTIEVWSLEDEFYQERVIAGHASMRRMNFINSGLETPQRHLLTSGLDGILRAYDIHSQTKIFEYYVGCGPIWDQCRIADLPKTFLKDSFLAAHEPLVVACDDGSVRVIFIPFDKSYVNQQTMALMNHIVLRGPSKRVLSVASQISRDRQTVWIWAGSQDGHVYRWDLKLGPSDSSRFHESGLTPESLSPAATIDLPRNSIPWTLQIALSNSASQQITPTEPHHLIIGDSEGQISVWDGAMGVLIQTLQHHKADILRLVLTPSQSSIFAIGVDNTISLYQRASNTTALGMEAEARRNESGAGSSYRAPWVFVGLRRSHTHDILAAVGSSDKLFTGGIDTKLIVHEYHDLLKLPGREFLPFAQSPSSIASLTTGTPGLKDRMVVQLENRLQVWRLGKPLKNGNVDPKTNHHDILEEQTLLLDITPKLNGRIMCHATSSRAHRIALSDHSNTKVFCIRERGGAVEQDGPEKKEYEDQQFVTFSDPILTIEKKILIKGPSSRLIFMNNGTLVRVTPNSHLIQLWNVDDPDRPTLLHTFHEHSINPKSITTPLGNSLHSAELVSKSINNLVISANGKYLASSDLNKRAFVFSLETNQIVFSLPSFEQHITAMAFDPEEKLIAISLSSNVFWIYNIESKSLTEWSRAHSNKLPKKLTSSQEKIIGMVFHPTIPGLLFLYGHTFMFYAHTIPGEDTRMWKMIKAYQPLFVDFVDDGSIVLVERPWLKVLQHLPPPFHRQRFAT